MFAEMASLKGTPADGMPFDWEYSDNQRRIFYWIDQ